MKNQKNDFEQLYYDSKYEIKKLQRRIEELETELELVNKKDKKKINIRNQILRDFKNYKEGRKDVKRDKSK